jgi:hypothetical protein
MPGRENRSFEASRGVAELDRASSLQMGVILGNGLCGEVIIVVHSQIESIASDGQRLSCGWVEGVAAAPIDFVGEAEAGVPLDGGVGRVGVDDYRAAVLVVGVGEDLG